MPVVGSPRNASGNSTMANSPATGYGGMAYTSGYISRTVTNPASPHYRASGLSNVLATAEEYDIQQQQHPSNDPVVITSYDMSGVPGGMPSISHNQPHLQHKSSSDDKSDGKSQSQRQEQQPQLTGTLGLWNTRPAFTSFVNTSSNNGGSNSGRGDDSSASQAPSNRG